MVVGIIILILILIVLVFIISGIVRKKREKRAFLNAIRKGDKETVQLLISKGIDVDYYYYGKEVPLEIAIENNDKEMVSILADKCELNYVRNNPLSIAIKNGYKDIISILIANGADVNFENARALDFTEEDDIIKLLRSNGAKTSEEIEEERNAEEARKVEEERKAVERKLKEETEKEKKYWQDLFSEKKRRIECSGCKTEINEYFEVCPTCGKKIITVVGKDPDCDFNTIQEAIDSVEEGIIIKVRPGVYNEHLRFNKNVHIVGCEDTIVNKSSGELPIVVLDSDHPCVISIPIEIEGIIFTHEKDLQFDSLISFVKNLYEFENEPQYIEYESLFWVKSNACFVNIAILCSNGHGITISDSNATIDFSFIYRTNQYGIIIGNSASPSINNSIISTANFSCLRSGDNSSPKIHNCEIRYSKESGIGISETSTPKISNCKIHNNGCIGLACGGNSNPKIISCSIFGQKQGISIEGASSGIFEDCSIHSNKNIGIGILDESTSVITKCKIFSNEQNGIMMAGNAEPNISDCEISNNGERYAGLVCIEDSTPIVKSCRSYGVSSYGLHLAHNAAGKFENCEFNGVKKDSNYLSEFINCIQID